MSVHDAERIRLDMKISSSVKRATVRISWSPIGGGSAYKGQIREGGREGEGVNKGGKEREGEGENKGGKEEGLVRESGEEERVRNRRRE